MTLHPHKLIDCWVCNGTGEIEGFSIKTCEHCGGSGQVEVDTDFDPEADAEETDDA